MPRGCEVMPRAKADPLDAQLLQLELNVRALLSAQQLPARGPCRRRGCARAPLGEARRGMPRWLRGRAGAGPHGGADVYRWQRRPDL